MKNKFIVIKISVLLVFLAALVGCVKSVDKAEILPAVTYLGGNNTILKVAKELESVGLSNIDEFTMWAQDFAKTAGEKAKLKDEWGDPDTLTFDSFETMDGWENAHDFSDADCRMTAFLLLDGILKSEKVDKTYSGTYLMFDMEAIDNVARYKTLKKKRQLFTTVFGDKIIEDGQNPKDKFGQIWEEYGITVDNDRVSLLSVVVYDPDFKQTFVGHTGVLVRNKDNLLFVEKIAFEQPFQVTRVNNIDELLDILSKRGEYFGIEGDPGPYVYLNGEFYRELKKS